MNNKMPLDFPKPKKILKAVKEYGDLILEYNLIKDLEGDTMKMFMYRKISKKQQNLNYAEKLVNQINKEFKVIKYG